MNTENPNVDEQTPEGAAENQTAVSQEKGKSIAGAPQNSQELLQLKKDLELTRSELKGLQSRQDREKNDTQRFMDEVRQHMAKGLSLDEAETAVNQSREAKAKDDLLYKIAQKVGVGDESPQNVAGNNSNAADEVAEAFSDFGVDLNDPAAQKFQSLRGKELYRQLGLYAKTQTASKPDSSEATSIQGGPPQRKDESVEALTKQYQSDMLKARGNAGLLKSIKEDARKKGVPVDSVVFV